MISRHRLRARRRIGHLNQVLHDDEADDVVEVLGEDRQARILLLLHELPQVVDRRVRADRDDVGPRRHHLAHQRLAEVHDRSQQPALVGARCGRVGRRRCGVRGRLDRRARRWRGVGRRPSHPMISAVSGPIALATTVNGGSRSSSTRSGDAAHDERRQQLADADRDAEAAGEQRRARRRTPCRRCASSTTMRTSSVPRMQPRRDEELERIVEVGRQRVALALPLGLEPLRQPHEQSRTPSRRARRTAAPARQDETGDDDRIIGGRGRRATADQAHRQPRAPAQALFHSSASAPWSVS